MKMKMKRGMNGVLLALVVVMLTGGVLRVGAAETEAEKDARMRWWREARFGMFIHWGIYSVPAGVWQGQEVKGIGEWIMLRGKIPVKDYAQFATQFDPVKFDADQWVKAAKDAGMKYIVITAKHHDGFAMFRSVASPYNIVDATPFGRDPLAELAAACRRQGMRLGFYYSQAQDWHHPGGAAREGGHWDPAQDGSMDDYLHDVAAPQVKELLTHYGPVSVLWWDTPEGMTPERAAPLAELLKLQPGIITNNRLGGRFLGDTDTPEQKIPGVGFPRDWESCMTMNDTWGFKTSDQNWKSAQTLVRNLITTASKGGNYLLNVGPMSDGEMPAASLERLREVGAWMKQNSEAIYGTKAGPFRSLEWGRATAKGDALYLHVFDWPKDGVLVVPMRHAVRRAALLADSGAGGKRGPALKTEVAADGLHIHLPDTTPDPIATVIRLDGVGSVGALPAPPRGPDKDGKLELEINEAELGGAVKIESDFELNTLNTIGWRAATDTIRWPVHFAEAGSYDVVVVGRVTAEEAGKGYTVALGDQVLNGTTGDTKGKFQHVTVGKVEVKEAGEVMVTVRAGQDSAGELMKLRAVQINRSKGGEQK